MRDLNETVQILPDEVQKELFDFADFLAQKYKKGKKAKKLKLDWVGSLAHIRHLPDPVDLQHQISDDWGKVHVSD